MAEREGFEPSVEVSPHTRLAGARLQPTRPSLRWFIRYNRLKLSFQSMLRAGRLQQVDLAEGVGFEPTELLHSTVFKTAALNHSAIPP